LKRRSKQKNLPVVLLAAAIALAMVITASLRDGRPGLLSRAVNGFFYPAQRAVTLVCQAAQEASDRIDLIEKYKDENNELRAQVAQLQVELSQNEDAKKENEELRSLLKLTKENTSFRFIPADVSGGASGNFSSDFTIAMGTADGVDTGMCVVSIEGDVVGSITQTGLHWARVTTILDPTSMVSAAIEGSSFVAVAGGDYACMSQNRFVLKYIPSDCELHIGDVILTTGSGDIYPAGLRLGQVESFAENRSGLDELVIVKPFASPDNLSRVFVVCADGN